MDLKTLETRAEQGVVRAEQGWREFAEAMREIKESEAYKEAGYRYFQTYYREVWEERTSKTFGAVKQILATAATVEEMEKVAPRDTTLPETEYQARALAGVSNPEERVQVWESAVEANNGEAPSGRQMERFVREHNGEPARETSETQSEGGEDLRVRDVLSEDDYNALPSKHLDASEKLAYRSSSIKSLIKGVDPAKTVATMRKNPDTFESKVDDWREIVEVGQEIIAEAEKAQRQPLRVVGGE